MGDVLVQLQRALIDAGRSRREGDIAIVAPDGEYDVRELPSAFEGALSSFAAGSARGLMLDLSRSQSLGDRAAQDVRNMDYFVASFSDQYGTRFAMVAPFDLAFGLVRLGSVITGSHGVATRVFREYDVAMEWLASAT